MTYGIKSELWAAVYVPSDLVKKEIDLNHAKNQNVSRPLHDL